METEMKSEAPSNNRSIAMTRSLSLSSPSSSSRTNANECGRRDRSRPLVANSPFFSRARQNSAARPGFMWEIGGRLEARDFMNIWYPAKIVQMNEVKDSVLIHFDGWNQRYDEWVKMASSRLRPLTRHSDRKKSKIQNRPAHKVGDCIHARWSDCRKYPATIVSVNANGSFDVVFDDGVRKTIQSMNVSRKPPAFNLDNMCSVDLGKKVMMKSDPKEPGSDDDHLMTSVVPIENTQSNQAIKGCTVNVSRCASPSATEEKEGKDRTKSTSEGPSIEDDEKEAIKEEATNDQDKNLTDEQVDSSIKKRRLIHVKSTHVRNRRNSSMSIATESKTEDEDNAQLKCPHVDCNKSFRNSTLLQYHLKYYHLTPQPTNADGKRKITISISSESEISVGGPTTTSMDHISKKRKHSETTTSINEHVMTETRNVPLTLQHDSLGEKPPLLTRDVTFRLRKATETRRRDRRRTRSDRRRGRDNRLRRRKRINVKVINCTCRLAKSSGPLIQCTVCLCWQHRPCLELKEMTGLYYICEICRCPRGLRESSRYSFDQEWLYEGHLAKFNLLPEEPFVSGKAKIMKATHELVADVHCVRQAIDSINRQIFIIKDKVEPEFSLWNLKEKERRMNTINSKCQLSSVNESTTVTKCQLSFVNESTIDTKCQLSSVNESMIDTKCQLSSVIESTIDTNCQLSSVNESTINTKCQLSSVNESTMDTEYQLSSANESTIDTKCQLSFGSENATDSKCPLPSVGESDSGDGKLEEDAESSLENEKENSKKESEIENVDNDDNNHTTHNINVVKLPSDDNRTTRNDDVEKTQSTTLSNDNHTTLNDNDIVMTQSTTTSNGNLTTHNDDDVVVALGSEKRLLNGKDLKAYENGVTVKNGMEEEDASSSTMNDSKNDEKEEEEGFKLNSIEMKDVLNEGEKKEQVKEETDFEMRDSPEIGNLENNLLEQMNRMQDTIDSCMSIIEEQVTALESGQGNGNSGGDVLRDLPRVKKTIHQLIMDLNKVQQISMYH